MKKQKYICLALLSVLVIQAIYWVKFYYDVTYFDLDKSFSALLPEEVIEKLGKPDTDIRFTLTDSTLYEFRTGLLYRWSEEYIAHHPIQIREMWWKTRRRTTVVWFDSTSSKWRSINKLTWGREIEM